MLVVCVAEGVKAQENPTTDLQRILVLMGRTMQFNRSLPQEKAYLHFDNTGYFKGETMYFKAYVTRTDVATPTDISKILYVELVNPTGDIITTHRVKLENGEGYGDIKLDTILGSGFFEVRAYTRYMTNWGNGAAFSRVFPIFNEPKTPGDYSNMTINKRSYRNRLPDMRESETGKIKKLNVRLFPEGGELVAGVMSKVAFTVKDADGLYLDAKGYLEDDNGNKLADVATSYEGKGTFYYQPAVEGKQTVRLMMLDANGGKHRFSLPDAASDGCTMQLDVMDDELLTATVRASENTCGQLLGYVMMHDGNVVAYDTLKAEPQTDVQFYRNSMPDGVSQLTLFNASGRILAERLFFICPQTDDADSIRFSSQNTSVKPCGKIVVNLHTRPNASISFSAMDAATMTNGVEGNAKTWMLLSSEVKGYIEHPGYYLEADDANHRQAADLLMMIQGWRRYDWKLMSGQKRLTKMQPAEDALALYGQLQSKRKKWSVDHVEMNAIMWNAGGQVVEGKAITDSLGQYKFTVPDVNGEWNLQIRTTKDDKPHDYVVCIDRHFSPETRELSPYENRVIPIASANLMQKNEDTKEEYVPLDKRVIVLPSVSVKEHRLLGDFRVKWFDEAEGKYFADLYYNCDVDADKYADQGLTVPTLFNWLHTKNTFFGGNESDFKTRGEEMDAINEGGISTDQKDMTGNITGATTHEDGPSYNNRPIVWIVDNTFCAITNIKRKIDIIDSNNKTGVVEVPTFIDEVKSVYISDRVDMLPKFINSPDLATMSPIIIFVYRHPLYDSHNPKGLRKTHFQGFNVPTTFEMEDYSVLPPMEDFRRTLFWAPDVKTDANGDATVEFFNNSSARQFFISAEGITPEGHILVSE